MKQFLTLAIVLLLFAQSTITQDIDPCLERGGFMDEETGRCVVTSGLSFEILYPLELLDYPFAMAVVDEFLNTSRQSFLEDFVEMGVPSSGTWTLVINYELFQFSETVLSVRFDVWVYTGGAHGNQAIQTFVFDVANETVLGLGDIFISEEEALANLAPRAQVLLAENLGEFADNDWIATGASPDIVNYQDFVLKDESIVFYFEPYLVAAYAAGVQTVEIPLSELSTILNTEFVPTDN